MSFSLCRVNSRSIEIGVTQSLFDKAAKTRCMLETKNPGRQRTNSRCSACCSLSHTATSCTRRYQLTKHKPRLFTRRRWNGTYCGEMQGLSSRLHP